MDQVLEALGISSAGAVFSAALTMLVCLIAIKVVRYIWYIFFFS